MGLAWTVKGSWRGQIFRWLLGFFKCWQHVKAVKNSDAFFLFPLKYFLGWPPHNSECFQRSIPPIWFNLNWQKWTVLWRFRSNLDVLWTLLNLIPGWCRHKPLKYLIILMGRSLCTIYGWIGVVSVRSARVEMASGGRCRGDHWCTSTREPPLFHSGRFICRLLKGETSLGNFTWCTKHNPALIP